MKPPILQSFHPFTIALTAGLLLLNISLAVGQNESPLLQKELKAVASQSGANPSQPVSLGIQFIILKSGSLFSGKLEIHGGQFIVHRSNGASIRLNANEIDFVANSFLDAYQKLKLRLNQHDVRGHYKLANWCLRYRELDSASQQIDYLRAISKNDVQVQSLQRRLESLKPKQPTIEHALHVGSTTRIKPLPKDQPMVASNAQLRRLIDSLSSESLRRFNSDIHPRLTNGCAIAKCHAGGQTSLRLWRGTSDGGIKSKIVQRNLYGVMQFVQRQSPSQSPLLSYISSAHGGQDQPAYGLSSDHYRLFKQWVNSTESFDRNGDIGQLADPHVQQAGFVEHPTDAFSESLNQQQDSKEPPSPVNLLKQKDKFVPRDPFDPEIFNRMFHATSVDRQNSPPHADQSLTNTRAKTRNLPPVEDK